MNFPANMMLLWAEQEFPTLFIVEIIWQHASNNRQLNYYRHLSVDDHSYSQAEF